MPTYNERENIPLVIARLKETLQGLDWGAIFVDDDSPDGTAEVVRESCLAEPNIHLIHRVGRRGLSSACIEGMLATEAPYIAIMDADLQHDEAILPEMLALLRRESLDIVVGTRNAEGGSMGDFHRVRRLLSWMGRRLSRIVCRCPLTDPMSGFFLLRRSFASEVLLDLHGRGFKILVDLLASARRRVRLGEVGYTFRNRAHGTSKLNLQVGFDFLSLVLHKLTRTAPSPAPTVLVERVR